MKIIFRTEKVLYTTGAISILGEEGTEIRIDETKAGFRITAIGEDVFGLEIRPIDTKTIHIVSL